MTENNETMKEAYEVIQSMMMQAFNKFPVSMRIRYLANTLPKDSTFEPEKLIKLLSDETSPYDFNAFYDVHDYGELLSLVMNIHAASLGLSVWRIGKCVDCKNEFYMMKGEVDFFEEKGFQLPKRCKSCRNKRKNGFTR